MSDKYGRINKKKRFTKVKSKYAAAKVKKNIIVKKITEKIDSLYRKLVATLFGVFFGSSGVGYFFLGVDFAYSIAMFFLAAVILVLISLLITRRNMKNNEKGLINQFEEEKRIMLEQHQKQISTLNETNLQMTEAILEKMYQILESIADGTWEKNKVDYRIHAPKITDEIYEEKKGIKRVKPLEK